MKKILLAMIHGLLPILGIVIVSIIALAVCCTECLGACRDIAAVIVLIVVAWIMSAAMWYKHN